ncbi:MAG: ABC transporter ATP-binding protein [Gammaproteobacteria bacterium]|nr:ABC transporter ATP-binding protein [Gammaproteobacteria bacterium]TVS07852.1 MAG: ABC transporter ATP-binding protein [Planctomycetaceae bacterium]
MSPGQMPNGTTPVDATANGLLLQISNLTTVFDTRAGRVVAVAGVDLTLRPGEILGLVGESGSGKSVTGFSILGLIDPPGRVSGGSILFRGRELVGAGDVTLRQLRGRDIAMIFQDPMMTLNPVLRIDTQIIEAVRAHTRASKSEARERALEVLTEVGIPAPEERLKCYPHQLSGGMRQRVAIAIALLHRPSLIIADEPTTALDVTIQAQIVHLMQRLCRESGTALLWITHDLAVIDGMADRVCVMYAGRIVEQGPVRDVLASPAHPYSRGLVDSVPANNRRGEPLRQIRGMAASPLRLPAGCAFQPRCDHATERCRQQPEAVEVGPDRLVRCFHPLTGREVADRA